MKLFNFKAIALASMLIGASSSFAHADAISKLPSSSIAPMLKRVTPDVVNIAVQTNQPSPALLKILPPGIPKSALPRGMKIGSGVVINAAKGYIVTNAHVVKDSKNMIVTLKSGRHYVAKVLGKDSGFDLAIIQIHAPKLRQIKFADSDSVQVGDFVAAIGSPYGLSQSVTSGMISALNRSRPKIEGFQSFIQTDAPINPGNSGGALVNMKGELIGINTAILAPVDGNTGIGFAIPSNMVKSVVTQLLKYGKVSRGMLGVIAQNITPDLAQALGLTKDHGVIVTQVTYGSPAKKAGVKAQDIILKVNGHNIRDAVQLRNMLGMMHPGTKLTLSVLRNHAHQTLYAKVANPKTLLAQRALPFTAGLSLQNYNALEADGTHVKGVLVTNVADASAGSLGGLLPGDVIVDANNHATHSLKALEAVIQQNPTQLLLTLQRRNTRLYAVIDR